MWLIAADVWLGHCVCVCVCVSKTFRYPAKMAGPIEMLFGMWSRVGPQNCVLDGGPDTPGERAVLVWGRGRPIVKYREHELWATERWLTRPRWHLAHELAGTQGTIC